MGNSADLPISVDDVLVAAKLFQPHRAAGVQLLGGDAHLAAQPELSAIGKAGGTVHIHGGTVHSCREPVGVGLCPGQDGFAVAGGVSSDVGNGLVHAVHDLDGQNVIQKLGVKVLRACRDAGDDGRGALVQP